MHGQKKRRKRTLGGALHVDAYALNWTLVSEPQWSNSTQRYIGICVSVCVADAARRELLIEFAFPRDACGRRLYLPQRPRLHPRDVEQMIRLALADGWDPDTRGRTYRFVGSELEA